MRRGRTTFAADAHGDARRHFERSLEIAQNVPSRIRGLGMDQIELPRRERLMLGSVLALAHLEETDEDWIAAQQRYEHALTLWGALEAEPKPQSTWKVRAGLRRALTYQGDIEGARSVHESVVAESKSAFVTRAQWASELQLAGYSELAVQEFERGAIPHDPDSWPLQLVPLIRSYADALDGVSREAHAVEARSFAARLIGGTHFLNDLGSFFSWPDDAMPLRVSIERPRSSQVRDPDRAVELTRDAFRVWTDAVRPGVPSFVFVTKAADIKVHWKHDRYGETYLGLCRAKTNDPDELFNRADIRLVSRSLGLFLPDATVRRIAIHEAGHALGLMGHSAYVEDVMFRNLSDQDQPTERDLRTLRLVYRP